MLNVYYMPGLSKVHYVDSLGFSQQLYVEKKIIFHIWQRGN